MKKSLSALTVGFALVAGSAAADARSHAYENLMQFFGAGQAVLAHEFANCPVYHASERQLYAIGAASTDAEMDAAVDAVFESSPAALNCVFEVINRYDLLEDLPGTTAG